MKTTDPTGPHWKDDQDIWRQEILAFCDQTRFIRLNVVETEESELIGRVTFHVTLLRGDGDVSFGETSRFRCTDGHWLYTDGIPYPTVETSNKT